MGSVTELFKRPELELTAPTGAEIDDELRNCIKHSLDWMPYEAMDEVEALIRELGY